MLLALGRDGWWPPVILLHEIAESWACWHHQMATLSQQFRVIALDLKGYVQSRKPDGDYSGTTVARKILSLLDEIDGDTFHIAGNHWSVRIADNVINLSPNRVTRYVCC